MANKIVSTTDSRTGNPFGYSTDYHGTFVAGCAGAETDGGGNLASVGFNTTLSFYDYNISAADIAYHASFNDGVDVISYSWGGITSSTLREKLLVQEVLDNNTVIVRSAGNTQSDSDNNRFPFAHQVDSRIIIVSSTDKNDNHTHPSGTTHANYPAVDICAPGYNVMGAIRYNNGTVSYPYQVRGGTSYATPIVAGVCALLKSIDKNLTPSQIGNIIKTTADPITDANFYPGQLGGGRVNAYEAVKATNAIVGPSIITPSGTFIFSTGESSTWNVSSGFIITPSPDGKSAKVKPQYFNGPSGTVTAKVNGVTYTKPIQHVFITGSGYITSPVTYSLNTGQTATWNVSYGFSITPNPTETSATVTKLNGTIGEVTAVLADGTVITKSIGVSKPTIAVHMYAVAFESLNVLSYFYGDFTLLGYPYPTGGCVATGYFDNPMYYNMSYLYVESDTYFTESFIELYPITFGGVNHPLLEYLCYIEVTDHNIGEVIHTKIKTGVTSSSGYIGLFEDGCREPILANNNYYSIVVYLLLEEPGRSGQSGVQSIKVKAYPNPVSHILNIEIDQQSQSSTSLQTSPTYAIRLYDGQGNLLRFAKTKGGTVQFDVSNLLDGIYYLHVYDEVNRIPEMLQIMVER